MDYVQNFSGKADDYSVGRPAYAETFLDYLYENAGLSAASVIADVGSGTGKFSAQMLLRGSTVFGVEPNADMRCTAEKELGGCARFCSVNGTAETTGLEAHSVDFVTVAQAFHWFEVEPFYAECQRILKPGGKVILIWNRRDASAAVNQAWHKVCATFCPGFTGFNGGVRNDEARIRQFFRNRYESVCFDAPLVYSKAQFESRCLSSSYSLTREDAGFPAYLAALSDLFDRYATDGVLSVPNQTVAYVGTV